MIVGLTEAVMSLFPTSYITFHHNFVSTGYLIIRLISTYRNAALFKEDTVEPPNNLKYIQDSVVVCGRFSKNETIEQQFMSIFQLEVPTHIILEGEFTACNYFLVTI